jgi:hypothetical protein
MTTSNALTIGSRSAFPVSSRMKPRQQADRQPEGGLAEEDEGGRDRELRDRPDGFRHLRDIGPVQPGQHRRIDAGDVRNDPGQHGRDQCQHHVRLRRELHQAPERLGEGDDGRHQGGPAEQVPAQDNPDGLGTGRPGIAVGGDPSHHQRG